MTLMKTVREVASGPSENSSLKGKENFTETAIANGVKSCNDFEN